MKKQALRFLAAFLLLSPCVEADVYIVNTTDERLTYVVTLPNGDTAKGEIKENEGYGPTQTTIRSPDKTTTTFKVMSESGASGMEVKAGSDRMYMLAIVKGSMQMLPISWNVDNGQSHRREMTIFNATGKPQTFDVIDEKEIRPGFTLEPGTAQTFPAKNGFGMGFQTLRFSDGQRLDNGASTGDYNILYMDSRSPGKVQCDRFGHITAPNGTPTP